MASARVSFFSSGWGKAARQGLLVHLLVDPCWLDGTQAGWLLDLALPVLFFSRWSPLWARPAGQVSSWRRRGLPLAPASLAG